MTELSHLKSRETWEVGSIIRTLVGLKVTEAEISLASQVPSICHWNEATDSQATKHIYHNCLNESDSRFLNKHSRFESMGNANLRCTI